MNRRRAMKSLAAAAAAAAVPRPAPAAGGPSATIYLKRWTTAKKFTIEVVDAMPAEHFGFKPTPDMRSFGELMNHLSGANTRYFARIKGAPPPKEPAAADKETVKKFMAESFDWCAQILGGLSEDDLAKSYPGATATAVPLSGRDLVLNGFIHTSHHRGYSEVYLRLKGVPPPRYDVV